MNFRPLFLLFVVFVLFSTACTSAGVSADPYSETTTPISVVAAADETEPAAQEEPLEPGRTPPQKAYDACQGKSEHDTCEFVPSKGTETGLCEMVQGSLACSPQRDDQPAQISRTAAPQPGNQHEQPPESYNLEQALSDRAQSTTIAFDALAFLSGSLGADSFFPPGKVADFWGFQYLRDNDASQMGHNTDFLTRAALNMLVVLTPEQRTQLVRLAETQVDSIQEYGYRRFVLMDAFRRLLENDLPAGTSGLNEVTVRAFSAELYRLDGDISYERAQVMGSLISSLDPEQRAYLDAMVGKDMLEWPDVEEPEDLRGLERDVKVAVMTYAGDMYSWYAGSLEADVYFCPERHGTYFGSFYLKDAPAVGNPDISISTSLTGDMGDAFLDILTPEQSQLISELVDLQRPYLDEVVTARQEVSGELRRFIDGETADYEDVMMSMEQYGMADGAIVYHYAVNFQQVYQSLSAGQKEELVALRRQILGDMLYPTGAYLYSQPIPMPEIPNSDFLFR